MDRRVPIFLVFAVVCVALVPVADPQHRWVAWTTAGAYVALAFVVAVDSISRKRATRAAERDEERAPSR